MTNKKSLYNEDYSLTNDGTKIAYQAEHLFQYILDEYVELGYSPREIHDVFLGPLRNIMNKKILRLRTNISPGMRNLT